MLLGAIGVYNGYSVYAHHLRVVPLAEHLRWGHEEGVAAAPRSRHIKVISRVG